MTSLKNQILKSASTAALVFLVCDPSENEGSTLPVIEQAIIANVVTVDEIVAIFRKEIEDSVKKLAGYYERRNHA